MSEDILVRHGAPTLAGIKTASLFTCPCTNRQELLDDIRQMNRRLHPKGLRILPLRFSENKALIYIYRPRKLTRDLADSDAANILRREGYDTGSCEKCVVKLVQKLRQDGVFPHEIGLFLGYPPEDVKGFIEKGPDCCKASGCWKVYGDEESAKKKFAQFKKCTQVYCDQWARGKGIDRLAVKDRAAG
ncbi:MAG: DUF3793 family protein [Oscillospiraceae bacterium]|nr:DUF3793 family protein [Oscillospiraceae bacterium]